MKKSRRCGKGIPVALGLGIFLICAASCVSAAIDVRETETQMPPESCAEDSAMDSMPLPDTECPSDTAEVMDTARPLDTEGIADTAGAAETESSPDTAELILPEETCPEEESMPPAPPVEVSVPDPVFSIPGGIRSGADRLALTLPDRAPAGAYILYTTDGSEPEPGKGKRYTAEIPILDGTDCTVIRAAVFGADGQQAGHIVTMTYLAAETSSLRVVSLVTDPDHLYGPSGILTDRSESGREGERPVSVEIFQPGGDVLLRQDAAIRLSGAGSRSFDPANLRIIARKPEDFAEDAFKYNGRGKFHAALFENSACDAYDRFLLRCGGNDSLHQANDHFLRMNMLRDAVTNNICVAAETLLGGTVFAQRSQPVAVYLNGEYYGMLNMKEDFDENLIESCYGLPEEGIALLKGKKDGKLMYYNIESGTDGDLADWQALCAFCAAHACAEDYAEAYEQVEAQLDLANFSRYFAVMLYLCNTDWPQNNTMVWRYTPTAGDQTEGRPFADGKWRAVIRDMDLCFALHDKASQTSATTYSMADTDTFYRITVFYRDGGYHYNPELGLYDDTMGFQGLFDFLMRSEDFRRMFRADCAALASEDFAELCRAEIERYHALAAPEIPAHLRLWQARGEIHAQYTLRHFNNSKQDMLTFVRERPGYFLRYLDEALTYYN